jgi:hypothetical protein
VNLLLKVAANAPPETGLTLHRLEYARASSMGRVQIAPERWDCSASREPLEMTRTNYGSQLIRVTAMVHGGFYCLVRKQPLGTPDDYYAFRVTAPLQALSQAELDAAGIGEEEGD